MDRGKRKEKEGVVVSDRMNKTIIVEVKRVSRHPIFKKVIKSTQRFKAHDERNEAKMGDRVIISETRRISKQKRWRLVKILGHGLVNLRELPARKVKEEESSDPSTELGAKEKEVKKDDTAAE